MWYIIGKAATVITALAAINFGASIAFDVDVLRALPKNWARLAGLVVGVAGVLSLLSGFRICP